MYSRQPIQVLLLTIKRRQITTALRVIVKTLPHTLSRQWHGKSLVTVLTVGQLILPTNQLGLQPLVKKAASAALLPIRVQQPLRRTLPTCSLYVTRLSRRLQSQVLQVLLTTFLCMTTMVIQHYATLPTLILSLLPVITVSHSFMVMPLRTV